MDILRTLPTQTSPKVGDTLWDLHAKQILLAGPQRNVVVTNRTTGPVTLDWEGRSLIVSTAVPRSLATPKASCGMIRALGLTSLNSIEAEGVQSSEAAGELSLCFPAGEDDAEVYLNQLVELTITNNSSVALAFALVHPLDNSMYNYLEVFAGTSPTVLLLNKVTLSARIIALGISASTPAFTMAGLEFPYDSEFNWWQTGSLQLNGPTNLVVTNGPL